MSDTFPDGWLREQIRKSAETLDGLSPKIRGQLTHRTNQRSAYEDMMQAKARMDAAPTNWAGAE